MDGQLAIRSREHLPLQVVRLWFTPLPPYAPCRFRIDQVDNFRWWSYQGLAPCNSPAVQPCCLRSPFWRWYGLPSNAVLKANDDFSRDHYHPFHLQPHRHPLRTFTPLPVLFVVCATSTFSRLAHTIPPPNKVGVHLTFINSAC